MRILKPLPGTLPMPGYPLADAVGHWSLNSLGNKVFDLSGNGNDGTLSGTSPSWTSGKFGPAILLPGTDESIQFGSGLAGLKTTAGTVIVWFKVDSGNSGNWQFIFSHRTVATDNRIYIVTRDTDDHFGIAFADSFWSIDSGVDVVGDGLWHMGAVTWNSTQAEGYLDGVSFGTDVDTLPSIGGDVTMGVSRSGTNPFDGWISCLLIYNRTLSASEIALLYREPFCYMQPSWNWSFYVPFLAAPTVGAPQVITIIMN